MILIANFFNASYAQISLWRDTSIYDSKLVSGDVIKVKVEEIFHIKIDSKWDVGNKTKLSLSPDTKILPFLSPSTQSKNRHQNTQAKYRMKDTLNFQLQAVIGTPKKGSKLYPIQAKKSILMNSKPTQITLSGLINSKYVKNNTIKSIHIVNLKLNIQTQPSFSQDNSIVLKSPRPEEIIDPKNPPPDKAKLSEQEKQRILLKYIQKIVGQLNQ